MGSEANAARVKEEWEAKVVDARFSHSGLNSAEPSKVLAVVSSPEEASRPACSAKLCKASCSGGGVPEAGKQYCCKYCLQDDDPRYQPLSAIMTDVNAAKELCVQKMLPEEMESIGATNNWPKKIEYAQAVVATIQRVIS